MSTETTLKVVRGGNLQRRFRRKSNGVYQTFNGVVVRSQIWDKLSGGRLVLDLVPYFSVNADDDTSLDLFVPGSATVALTTDGVWDIFFDDQYITGGPVDVQLAVSLP